ncbi:MAG: hypothetical protein IKH88_13930 [Prevotella sp.]|nr:hypothetical protein [Prevotella sp.]
MKHLLMSLIFALMSVMVSVPASASTGKNENGNVPENIVVKQTTHFNDGRTLTVYYKKQGDRCEIYSPCDIKSYTKADMKKIKSTNFEVVDETEGKLYMKTTMNEMMRVLNQMVNQKR